MPIVPVRWSFCIFSLCFVCTSVFLLRFVHPRFGPIKCIRTLRAVQKDEELTVAYGYDHESLGKNGPEVPDWYKHELEVFQQRQAAPVSHWNPRGRPPNSPNLCCHFIKLLEHCCSCRPSKLLWPEWHKNYARNHVVLEVVVLTGSAASSHVLRFTCSSLVLLDVMETSWNIMFSLGQFTQQDSV